MVLMQEAFAGCLIGGAAGDALGYPVEFMSLRQIQHRFGAGGIAEYVTEDGVARISDDTQMTMFTAEGLLYAETFGVSATEGICEGYRAWYLTQTRPYPAASRRPQGFSLLEHRALYAQRAPGSTCMSAIGGEHFGTVARPCNHSKGCGGVMRVAPVGLACKEAKEAARLGAEAAALTHGHPLGYLPAAALSFMIHRLVHGGRSMGEAVAELRLLMAEMFSDVAQTAQLLDLLDRAVELSAQEGEDSAAIAELGEGWVAEQTLAIAVYCALKYEKDFGRALIAAVNHDGDSDSTGAVTGNLLGARWGLAAIPAAFVEHLELREELLALADRLVRLRFGA